jgi:hypothetical protein
MKKETQQFIFAVEIYDLACMHARTREGCPFTHFSLSSLNQQRKGAKDITLG